MYIGNYLIGSLADLRRELNRIKGDFVSVTAQCVYDLFSHGVIQEFLRSGDDIEKELADALDRLDRNLDYSATIQAIISIICDDSASYSRDYSKYLALNSIGYSFNNCPYVEFFGEITSAHTEEEISIRMKFKVINPKNENFTISITEEGSGIAVITECINPHGRIKDEVIECFLPLKIKTNQKFLIRLDSCVLSSFVIKPEQPAEHTYDSGYDEYELNEGPAFYHVQ